MVWTRPTSAPFPAMYTRFNGRSRDGGTPRRYRVQDVSDELSPRVVEFMAENFIANEPTCRGINLASDLQAVQDFKGIWVEALKSRLGLVCLLENEDGSLHTDAEGRPVIVGVNVTTVDYQKPAQEASENKFGPTLTHMLTGILLVTKNAEVYAKYGVKEYLTAYGLSVHINYRGDNIGTEILKARVPLCKAVGLKVTGTAFTAVASQILAARCGFELLYEISYKELVEKYNIDYGFTGNEVLQYMALKIE